MADMRDILGKKKAKPKEQYVELDGMCEECYWPLDHGFYDAKDNKLRVICLNGHERTIDWNMNG